MVGYKALNTKHTLDATPLPGFLTGAYAKMEAQSKIVDYAKHNSPIKSTTYYGSFTLCLSTGQNTSLTGSMTVQFYSNRVIKVDGEYYIPLDEENKDSAHGYILPIGHKLQNVRAVSLLHDNTEINYMVATEYGNTRNWFIHHYNIYPLSGSTTNNNGYNSGSYNTTPSDNRYSSRKCSSCGGTGDCSGCGGKGKYWQEVGQYTGHSTEKLIDCPICRGTGRCNTCHGSGSL